MAVMEIRVENLDRLQNELAKLRSLIQRNWKTALNDSLDFMEQKRAIPHLRTVPGIKAVTIQRKQREFRLAATPGTPLVRSGALQESLISGPDHKRGTDPAGLSGWTGTGLHSKHAVTSRPAPYPVLHQYGRGGQVKRQFLFFDKSDEKQVAEFFLTQLKDKIRKAGFRGV